MPSFDESLAEIHPESPETWRSWLADHHETATGVWVVYWRATTGRRRLSWEQAVREALCFGWIDSKINPIDDERYKQVFTPRKPKSVWSRVNKQHVAELTAEGRMTAAGLRTIEVAKANGAWTILEPIDDLVVPEDLGRALDRSPVARAAYEARSDTAKRAVLYPLYTAKRAETRAKRLAAALAELEADGVRD